MMNFLTTVFEEECIYSIKSRVLRDNLGSYNSYLGRFMKRVTSIDFPNHLFEFYEETKFIIPWTVDTIVLKHTLYKAYSAFMTKERQKALLEGMVNSSKNVHIVLGINPSSLKRSDLPKFCPLCSREDYAKYGEAYFHRLHQIPNLNVCPDHGCLTIEYCPSTNELSGFKYFHLTKKSVEDAEVIYNSCDTMAKISLLFRDLLTGKLNLNYQEINYKETIELNGFFKNNYLIRSELVDKFQKYYKGVRDEYLKSRVTDSYHWLGGIILRPHTIFNPFQYMLFNQFVEDMHRRTEIKIQHPFGSGPWLCFNKAANHYLKSVITNLTLEMTSENKTVGLFKCSCGMVYSKQFAKVHGSLKEKTRIRERGQLWLDKLNKCIMEGCSLRETARILGTAASTVRKIMQKKPRAKYLTTELVRAKRSEWKKHLKEFRYNSYSQCRVKYSALYSWMCRYDFEWLTSTKDKKQTYQLELRLNWEEIDVKLCDQISDTIRKLKIEKPDSRISKTLIGKLVNHGKYILSTNLQNLPKSKEILERNLESVEDYQIRRIQNAVENLLVEGKLITKSSLIRRAKIKHPSPLIVKRINSIV